MNETNEQPNATAATTAGIPKTPEPLFSCDRCREECSWPAKDIRLSRGGVWICNECWCDLEHGEAGIGLDAALKAQEAAKTAPLRELLMRVAFIFERMPAPGLGDWNWPVLAEECRAAADSNLANLGGSR